MNATITVGMFDAKTRFSELVEACGAGQEIIVTKRGAPVVRIVAIETEAVSRVETLKKFKAIRQRAGSGPSIKELVQEGRA